MKRIFYADTPESQESILILWSNNKNHPQQGSYKTRLKFFDYLDTHHYEWQHKSFPIQVD